MIFRIFFRLNLLCLLLLLNSCNATRNLVYLSDLKENKEYREEITNKNDPQIQPDDLLSITITSLSPESNILFNNGVMQPAGSNSSIVSTNRTPDGYLVDKAGNINFPVLGRVKLAGLTKEQATEKMTSEIKNHVKNPIINIRFLNFKITVVGEVNRPATFTIPTERISIIEALGMAGDMTSYGKRENVLIIREKNGERRATRVNLASKDILNSPDFYLQQNDIVYVEPIKAKALQGGASSFYTPLITSAISIILSVIIILTR
ncbi:polysaccharide biosynthesis/export family protein [Hymenobacter sp. HDW8]|uniref:polysaccharide biosynthesis/export family protein n=1 Tax=Hymenobacter sp. HDW8 TaxID=2714932 RepID=UPI00140C59A9|nr:polysaccharide biosynthesis/export family protein [Hymenobacter sp. HDW8]QIL75342.1 sugar transporter [Hymenobacter sp. HDW8]